jgi:hypothetical protein
VFKSVLSREPNKERMWYATALEALDLSGPGRMRSVSLDMQEMRSHKPNPPSAIHTPQPQGVRSRSYAAHSLSYLPFTQPHCSREETNVFDRVCLYTDKFVCIQTSLSVYRQFCLYTDNEDRCHPNTHRALVRRYRTALRLCRPGCLARHAGNALTQTESALEICV